MSSGLIVALANMIFVAWTFMKVLQKYLWNYSKF